MPHASLEPIGSSTGQHFVYTQNVERMNPDSKVESILSCVLRHVLIAGYTRCFQCLARHIFFLPADQMHARWEFVDPFFLHSNIVDSDFGIGDTSTVAGFWIRLALNLAITSSRPWKKELSHGATIKLALEIKNELRGTIKQGLETGLSYGEPLNSPWKQASLTGTTEQALETRTQFWGTIKRRDYKEIH